MCGHALVAGGSVGAMTTANRCASNSAVPPPPPHTHTQTLHPPRDRAQPLLGPTSAAALGLKRKAWGTLGKAWGQHAASPPSRPTGGGSRRHPRAWWGWHQPSCSAVRVGGGGGAGSKHWHKTVVGSALLTRPKLHYWRQL